jgi:dTDP-4-dehydrorhamnose 3,5-epimerase
MRFLETKLAGVWIIEPERLEDERGFFARTYDEKEFAALGLNTRWVQCSISFNKQRGTLRGMHYQAEPYGEIKLVSCTLGAIYDVVLDLRPESPTFKQWTTVELSAENRTLLYIPKGCAHGFQTLTEESQVFYQISELYHPEAARGVRWDDAAFGINWHFPPSVLSDRDKSFEHS